MTTPSLTGGCGCGAVRFELSAPMTAAAFCHCTRCRHRSGTAYQASGRIEPGALTLLQGEEELSKWSPGGLDKVFCGACGSHLWAASPEDGEVKIVRLGAMDGDPGVRPAAHLFTAYAAPWSQIPDDGLPRFEEGLPA